MVRWRCHRARGPGGHLGCTALVNLQWFGLVGIPGLNGAQGLTDGHLRLRYPPEFTGRVRRARRFDAPADVLRSPPIRQLKLQRRPSEEKRKSKELAGASVFHCCQSLADYVRGQRGAASRPVSSPWTNPLESPFIHSVFLHIQQIVLSDKKQIEILPASRTLNSRGESGPECPCGLAPFQHTPSSWRGRFLRRDFVC